jgi:ribonucleotide reductase beta subunit family protein with ferritin-like domain
MLGPLDLSLWCKGRQRPHKQKTMTITERNQRLYDLREQLLKKRAELAWIEQEIWLTNERYKNQDLDLYQEMFGAE